MLWRRRQERKNYNMASIQSLLLCMSVCSYVSVAASPISVCLSVCCRCELSRCVLLPRAPLCVVCIAGLIRFVGRRSLLGPWTRWRDRAPSLQPTSFRVWPPPPPPCVWPTGPWGWFHPSHDGSFKIPPVKLELLGPQSTLTVSVPLPSPLSFASSVTHQRFGKAILFYSIYAVSFEILYRVIVASATCICFVDQLVPTYIQCKVSSPLSPK